MRKLILIVHTTLDGFVAGEDGGLDGFNPSPENLDFVCSLTDEADTALLGRISYQMLEQYWPTARDSTDASESEIKYSNWYNDAHKVVLSKTVSNNNSNHTTIISENIGDQIRELKKNSGKNILQFGSPTAFQTIHKLGLIDEYYVIQYPVLFGKGIPFFTLAETPIKLNLLSTRQLSKGELVLHYSIEG